MQAKRAQERYDLLAKQDTTLEKEPGFVDEGEDSFVKKRWDEFKKLCSATLNTNTLAYQELEADFKNQYQKEKASQQPQQQEAMVVDGAVAPRKADDLEEVEAKRQRQSEEEAAAGKVTP